MQIFAAPGSSSLSEKNLRISGSGSTNPDFLFIHCVTYFIIQDNFYIIIETYHIADSGDSHNVHELEDKKLSKREVSIYLYHDKDSYLLQIDGYFYLYLVNHVVMVKDLSSLLPCYKKSGSHSIKAPVCQSVIESVCLFFVP